MAEIIDNELRKKNQIILSGSNRTGTECTGLVWNNR